MLTFRVSDYRRRRRPQQGGGRLPPLAKYYVTAPSGLRLRANGKAHHRLVEQGAMPVPGGRYLDNGRVRLKPKRASSTYTFSVRLNVMKNGEIQTRADGSVRYTDSTLTLTLKDGEELTSARIRECIMDEEARLGNEYMGASIDFEHVETYGVNGTCVDFDSLAGLANIPVFGERLKYFHDDMENEAQDAVNSGSCGIDVLAGRARMLLAEGDKNIPQRFADPAFYIGWFQKHITIRREDEDKEKAVPATSVFAAYSAHLQLQREREEVRKQEDAAGVWINGVRAWRKGDGLTMEEIKLFLDSPDAAGKISLYVIAPNDRLVVKHTKENSRMSVALRINGEHAYLLNRANLHLVQEKNFVNFAEEWPSASSMEGFVVVEDVETGMQEHPDAKGYLVCSMEDPRVATHRLYKKFKAHLPVKFTDHTISELKLPDGRFVIFRRCAPGDVEMQQRTQEKLASHIPVIDALRHYPTWPQLSRSFFFNALGELPKTTFSPDLAELFEDHKRGGFNGKTQAVEAKVTPGIDQSKAYAHVAITNKHLYSVFDVLDAREPFSVEKHYIDGSLATGWYVVNKPIKFPFFHSPIDAKLYPASFVAYALSHGALTLEDIDEAIIPNRSLKADLFRAPILEVFELLGPDAAKEVFNPFTGILGMTSSTKCHGAICDSFDVAACVHGREVSDGVVAHCRPLLPSSNADDKKDDDDEIFLVTHSTTTPLDSHHGPIYGQIIFGGIIEHLEVARRAYEASVYGFASQTDELFFDPNDMDKAKAMVDAHNAKCTLPHKIGTYKLSISTKSYDPTQTSVVENIAADTTAWVDVTKDEYMQGLATDMRANASAYTCGGPGHGKSHMLVNVLAKKLNPQEYIVLTTKTTVRDQLIRDKGCPADNVLTFANLHEQLKHEFASAKSILSEYDYIIVDEAPTCSPNDMALIVAAKRSNPDVTVVLFGDSNQTDPILEGMRWPSNSYDFMNNKVIMRLVNCRKVELPYIPASARYDEPLQAVVQGFLQTGNLPPEALVPSCTKPWVKRHIVFTNLKKKSVDTSVQAFFNREREVLAVIKHRGHKKQDTDIHASIGLPLIARENMDLSKKSKLIGFEEDEEPPDRVSNSERVLIADVDATKKIARLSFRYDESKSFALSFSQLVKYFELDFSISAHRAQSITIDEPTQVHVEDAQSMTKKAFYVAISRNRELSQLSFACSKHEIVHLPDVPYVHNPIEVHVAPVQGVIYQITNSVDSMKYVGQTQLKGASDADAAAQARFNEHCGGKQSGIKEHITKLGRDKFALSVQRSGRYETVKKLTGDETYFISLVAVDESLNEKQHADKRKATISEKREKVAVTVISKSKILPRVEAAGEKLMRITYVVNGNQQRKNVKRAMKRGVEDMEKTDAKLKATCLKICEAHYTPSQFPDDAPAAWVQEQVAKRRRVE